MNQRKPGIQITVRCACPSPEEYGCWLRRYPPNLFDAMGLPADPPTRAEVEAEGGPCSCSCHAFWAPDDGSDG